MPVKLFFPGTGHFILNNEAIDAFEDSMNLTLADGKERGHPLCVDPQETLKQKEAIVINAGQRCMGTTCSVRIGDCPAGIPGAGTHHTHPQGSTYEPSPGDMVNILWRHFFEGQPAFACRSGRSGGRNFGIQCQAIPDSALPTPIAFTKLKDRYIMHVLPAYDEWERTGEFPSGHPGWQAYEEIEQELKPFFTTIKFHTHNDLRDASWLASIPQKATAQRVEPFPVKREEAVSQAATFLRKECEGLAALDLQEDFLDQNERLLQQGATNPENRCTELLLISAANADIAQQAHRKMEDAELVMRGIRPNDPQRRFWEQGKETCFNANQRAWEVANKAKQVHTRYCEGVQPPPKPEPPKKVTGSEAILECMQRRSVTDLRTLAQEKGINSRGSHMALCGRLLAAGVI